MSLQRIAKRLARVYDMPEEVMQSIARDVLGLVESTVLETGSCVVRGFGSFRLQHRAPRPARNPRTGEPVLVPARERIVFAQGADRIRVMESAGPAEPTDTLSHREGRANARHTSPSRAPEGDPPPSTQTST